jgi:transketolase
MSEQTNERNIKDMKAIEQKAITNIRFLAAEAVQKAKSGHPGLPSAPLPWRLHSDSR